MCIMMKVLFIYPNVDKPQYEATLHFGIASLSATLKKEGHKTALLEVDKLDLDEIGNDIKQIKPDMVCYSAVSSQMPYVKEMAKISSETNRAMANTSTPVRKVLRFRFLRATEKKEICAIL